MSKKYIVFFFLCFWIAGCTTPVATTTPSPTDPARIPVQQEFVYLNEVMRMFPIKCFDGQESPYMFYWVGTASDNKSIQAYVSQDPNEQPVTLRNGDQVIIEWCGTRAEVGVLVIRPDNKGGIEALIDHYKKPIILESSASLPSWPSPEPISTPRT